MKVMTKTCGTIAPVNITPGKISSVSATWEVKCASQHVANMHTVTTAFHVILLLRIIINVISSIL